MSMEGVAAAAGTTAPKLRRRSAPSSTSPWPPSAPCGPFRCPVPPTIRAADALAILESLRVNLARRNGMAMVGTLLAEERRNPELLDRFRQRIDEPAAACLRQALAQGCARPASARS